MAFVGNVLWFIFGGGIVAWFFWVVSGILLAVTIVGLPFAVAHFKLAVVSFSPLGKRSVKL